MTTDPDFGTPLVRLSNQSEHGSFEAPIYSQLQAFSADGQFVLLDSPLGYRIRAIAGGALMPVDTSTWNAPRWETASEHSVLHYDANDNDTLVVQRIDVRSGVTAAVFTFPEQYLTVLGNQSFDEVSRDGRWMSGMATTRAGQDTIFVLDLVQSRITVSRTILSLYSATCAPDPQWGSVEPDWVGVSPLGRYLVVQWTRDGTARCSGLETFDIETGAFVGRVYDGHQHGDLGVDTDGTTEFFMTYELYHPSGLLSIGMRHLPGEATVSPPQYLQVLQWGNAEHISCQGPNGGCLVSTAGDPANGWNPFENELFIQYTDGTVDRLAHTRTTGCGYFAQSRGTWSADGRYVLFASDWNLESGDCSGNERVDPIMLIRSGSLPTPPPGPGEPPPPPPGPGTGPGGDQVAESQGSVPSAVRQLKVTRRRGSQATVTWRHPQIGGAELTYEYCYTSSRRGARVWLSAGADHAVVVTGLKRRKTYVVRVRAANSSGTGGVARAIIAPRV